jgi:hypothetical protein
MVVLFPRKRLSDEKAKRIFELCHAFVAQNFFEGPNFEVVPEVHQAPWEGARVFKKETVRIVPRKFNLLFVHLVSRDITQNFFKDGVVLVPRVGVECDAAPAIVSLSARNDRASIHGGFETDSSSVCQTDISDLDQVVGIDLVQRANDMDMAGDFGQRFFHHRTH